MKRYFFILALWVTATGLAGRLALAFEEPDGFEKAKWGMTAQEFAELYPEAVLVSGDTKAQEGQPALAVYRITGMQPGGLHDCRVDFRFFGVKPQLFDVQCLCSDSAEAMARYLTDRFGVPTTTSESKLLWTGEKTGISFVPLGKVFSIGDAMRSRAVQLQVLKGLGSAQLGNGAGEKKEGSGK